MFGGGARWESGDLGRGKRVDLISVGKKKEAFGVVFLVAGRAGNRVGNEIVDKGGAGSAGEA